MELYWCNSVAKATSQKNPAGSENGVRLNNNTEANKTPAPLKNELINKKRTIWYCYWYLLS